MLPTQLLLASASRIAIVDDEARPRSNDTSSSNNNNINASNRNKRGSGFLKREGTKLRVPSVPPRAAAAASSASTHRLGIFSPKRMLLTTHHHHARPSGSFMAKNVVVWMQEDCPSDILPKIIAYAGPQMAAALNATNRFWRDTFEDDSMWRVMCEELYKWKDGDELPHSWKEYYRYHPCVPVDYSSISAALAIASDRDEHVNHDACNMNPRVMEQRRSIKLLLRPGDYFMREAIVIHAVGENTCVTIESMDMPKIDLIQKHHHQDDPMDTTPTLASSSPANRIIQKAKTIRNVLTCRSVSVVQDEEMELEVLPPPAVRASIISRTRRINEPLFRVRQGTLKLVNLSILHNANGVDIWNGNAAIQVQPPIGPDDHPLIVAPRPCAILEKVDVCSRSGRGIVTIDGGSTHVTSSYVHDCAATGIYVGGNGSRATVERTDVLRNGNGNRSARRGIQRGHSGIYLEQGQAVIRDCNISRNSLTGISAVSQDNAVLDLSESDLVANGAQQLEMPPNGSLSRRRSFTRDNNMAASGFSRSRSGLVETDEN